MYEGGQVTGPFDEKDLMKRFEAGELLADDQVCDAELQKWVAIGDWLPAVVVAEPPVLLPPALPSNWGITGGEQPYFEALGIAVTRTRLIVGPQTYAMSGITSVRVERRPADVGGGVVLCIFGVLPLLGSLGFFADPRPGEWSTWWAPFFVNFRYRRRAPQFRYLGIR